MPKPDEPQSKGRHANAAEPPGRFTALGGKDDIKKTGSKSRRAAGPDGPDATDVGDTFKDPPGRPADVSGHA
jgi:hypothetical protein